MTEETVCSSKAITFIDCSDSRVAGGYIFYIRLEFKNRILTPWFASDSVICL